MSWTVPTLWEDGECWIIGGGPSMPRQFSIPEDIIQDVMKGRREASAYSPYLEALHDRHTIGINNAFKIGDWINFLFFGDSCWYVIYRNILPQVSAIKVSCCDRFASEKRLYDGIHYLARDRQRPFGISSDPSKVCWNNNSGSAAISLAVHLGVKRIFLLGFDMSLDTNKVSHWFGSHNKGGKRPPVLPFGRHMKGFPFIAADAKKMGVEILNCSPTSAIDVFPKVTVREVLDGVPACTV